jgi:thiamine biosynthesis lipoprotein
MGGPCEFRFSCSSKSQAEHLFSLAHNEVIRLEQKYSRYRDDSIVQQINLSHQLIALDDETKAILDYANTAYQISDGLFDITTGVLRRLWDFNSDKIPSSQAIAELLPSIGWSKIFYSASKIQVPEGMQIDFGGIVKEYASDAVKTLLIEQGLTHGLINLGGDISAINQQPSTPWPIGVRDAKDPQKPSHKILLDNESIATSGNYERFIEVNGKRYCHILNPKTGFPVENASSVSVVAPHCVIAGTLSTVAMLLPLDQAKELLDESGMKYLIQ